MNIQNLLQTGTQFLHSVINSINNAIIITDVDGNIEVMNHYAEELTGWSQQDAVGKSLKEILPLMNWSSEELYDDDIKKIKELGILKFNESNILVDHNGKDHVINGDAKTILDGDSQIIGITFCLQDISERYEREEIVKMQKFESLGILAGGIAHDFNNILTAILGNVSLAKIDSDPKDVLERLIDTEKALNRAKYLTQQLLNFSKDGLPIKEITSVTDLIKDSAKFMLSGSNVRCEFDIPDELWVVEVDENQINQVITNIVINAVQAMPKGGIIKITARNVILKDDEIPLLSQGNYIKISIQDHGIGISKENLQRIFDPYFTTKKEGTGLGLTVSFYIVRNHGGNILVDSELGVGTTFHIYLPASPEKKIDKKRESENLTIGGKGKILVLDDDNTIRELINTMLGSLGYDVTTVADGIEVIKEYKKALESNSPFDVVIMDLTIPGGMGARETIDILKELDPKVKAIVSSGYSNDLIVSEYKKYGFEGAITKPYGIKELCSVINNTIVMSS